LISQKMQQIVCFDFRKTDAEGIWQSMNFVSV
jgi:hypothetical protein